ncbi:MAG: YqgE/AlgH family protein [Chitinophagales bacterium]|nr:YqgE/AlgH family protein [Chitinophagales bacterium]
MESLSSGKILIAEPFMEDPFFKGSVVLLCEYKSEGAFGLIVNKPTEMKVHEVVEDFPAVENVIFYGGPVQPNTLHYLHKRGDLLNDSIEISDGIYWGGDFEKLIFLLDTKQISPDDIRFFFGYSGWDQDQLTQELKGNSWFIGKGSSEYLFREEPQQLWRTALRDMGDRYKVIANFPENPSLN